MLRDFPGDDRRAARGRALEIVAAEQRILTHADGLIEWMKETDWPPDFAHKVDRFFTHELQRNPGGESFEDQGPLGVTKVFTLEKLDPDANRIFLELLRAAWELRCWKRYYGEPLR